MIEKLLNKLGYIRKDRINEDYLCQELSKYIGDPTEFSIEPEQEKKLFQELSRIYGINEYLKATMAKDMQRDFGSPQDQRQLIRGAFARTAYIKSKVLEANKSLTQE